MAKSQKSKRLRRQSRKLRKRGGDKCGKCSCGGERLYVEKSGFPAYCICRKCGKSNFV